MAAALKLPPALPTGSTLVLETERLWLRSWHADDLPAFQRIVEDPEVMRFVLEGGIWPLERTQAWLQAQIDDFARLGYAHYALIPKSAPPDAAGPIAPIGFCGLRPGQGDGRTHTGWRLSRDWWGQGLASEAALAVRRHAFETLRLPHLTATAHQDNTASLRIMDKLGMVEERRYTTPTGRPEVRCRVDNPAV